MKSDIGRYGIMPEWLLREVQNGTAIRLFGLLAAAYADREGSCWPSRTRLAADLGASKDTVDRAISDLEAAGALEIEHRIGADGAYTSNLYRLVFTQPEPRQTGAGVAAKMRGGGGTDAARGGRKNAALTRPIKNQTHKEEERSENLSPRTVYEGLLRTLPGVSSSVAVPERYWSKWRGDLQVQDPEALERAVALGRGIWKLAPETPLKLPTQISRLEDLGQWALGRDARGKRIDQGVALLALREIGPPDVQPADTLIVLAERGSKFISAYDEVLAA